MLRLGAGRLAQLGKSAPLIGPGAALPAVLAGNQGRWDAYSGMVADTTNGGYKWNPVSGASGLVTIAGTGPGYSASAVNGRPGLLLSAAKSLISSPAMIIDSGAILFIAGLQLPVPTGISSILTASNNGTPTLRVSPDGSILIDRANQLAIANTAAGVFPFNVPVLLTYGYNTGNSGVKHFLWINKVPIAITNDTVSGGFVPNSIFQLGHFGASGASTTNDLVGAVSYAELGNGFSAATQAAVPAYQAGIYDRIIA